MTDLVKIDDEVITTEDFVKLLKFTGQFETLMEDIVKDKLIVHAAKKTGRCHNARRHPGTSGSVAQSQGFAPRR